MTCTFQQYAHAEVTVQRVRKYCVITLWGIRAVCLSSGGNLPRRNERYHTRRVIKTLSYSERRRRRRRALRVP